MKKVISSEELLKRMEDKHEGRTMKKVISSEELLKRMEDNHKKIEEVQDFMDIHDAKVQIKKGVDKLNEK